MEEKDKIREKIREMVASNLEEYDLIAKTKTNWDDEKKNIRSIFTNLLKHVEDDQYEKGVDEIDKAVTSLLAWKKKIEKRLDN